MWSILGWRGERREGLKNLRFQAAEGASVRSAHGGFSTVAFRWEF